MNEFLAEIRVRGHAPRHTLGAEDCSQDAPCVGTHARAVPGRTHLGAHVTRSFAQNGRNTWLGEAGHFIPPLNLLSIFLPPNKKVGVWF